MPTSTKKTRADRRDDVSRAGAPTREETSTARPAKLGRMDVGLHASSQAGGPTPLSEPAEATALDVGLEIAVAELEKMIEQLKRMAVGVGPLITALRKTNRSARGQADRTNRRLLRAAVKRAAWQSRSLESRLLLICKGIVAQPALPPAVPWAESEWADV